VAASPVTPAHTQLDATDSGRIVPRAPRAIAFYLPQFHPIPENDEFWGTGFTEWRNVVQATPAFRGHLQPHIPADLGFYDLRLPDVRVQQACLAQSYGLFGFCWYHYWFHGRRLLNQPFDDMLRSGEPEFPFCLCWANENWTRGWDGLANHVLIEQRYSYADHRAHIRFLTTAFADDRYIRVNGRPMFLVYRPSLIPDLHAVTDIWREEASHLGLGDLYLVRIERYAQEIEDPKFSGFDAAASFHPDLRLASFSMLGSAIYRVSRGRVHPRPWRFAYDRYMAAACAEPAASYTRFPSVFPRWDNTPRRGAESVVFIGCTPERYRTWLETSLKASRLRGDEDIVFINGWNEWGEGAHLEPDLLYGKGFLEQTQAALRI
jgi:lipopolysaccharide biosynthesis protein